MTYDDVLLLLEAPGLALQDLEAATERYERAFTRVAGGARPVQAAKCEAGADEFPREAAEHAIGSLPDWRKQFVLTSRYVDTPALTWPQIAEALGLSLRQTYRMKNNAINDICKMTDGRVLAAVS